MYEPKVHDRVVVTLTDGAELQGEWAPEVGTALMRLRCGSDKAHWWVKVPLGFVANVRPADK